jgi:hypothetical protein
LLSTAGAAGLAGALADATAGAVDGAAASLPVFEQDVVKSESATTSEVARGGLTSFFIRAPWIERFNASKNNRRA